MVRTRFAPSPTGMIHIGNLRTALFSYLIAKHYNGEFILRIEDTDQKRSEDVYSEYIFKSLKELGLNYDEGPDVGGNYGPYIQSERVKSGLYMKYAKQLVEQGDAYYCFCPDCHSDLERYKDEVHYGWKEGTGWQYGKTTLGYDGHCRHLTKEEVEENLRANKPYVIRQKIPNDKIITYYDEIIGELNFNSTDLEDQVLIKQDGYPTYNFANVIDDHLMNITHVIRGNEYISSTPKYVLLYQALGWDVPKFLHLPLIYIKNSEGKEEKLSKRFNCASFEGLINDGYLKDAIINYIVTMGWGTSSHQEIYSMEELIRIFDEKNINKASKVLFDNDKLNWFNHQYIVKMSDDQFVEKCKQYCDYNIDWYKVAPYIKNKIKYFSELNYELSILNEPDVYQTKKLYDYKKKDYNDDDIIKFVDYMKNNVKDNMKSIDYENLVRDYSKISHINFGSLMYIYRMIICGRQVIIMSATDVSEIVGKINVLKRFEEFLNFFNKNM